MTAPAFSKTKTPNLKKHSSGTYYARFRAGRREVWRSLKTKSYAVAREKLVRVMAEERARAGVGKDSDGLTLGMAAAQYLEAVHRSDRKPRSKDYRRETVDALRRTWPDFDRVKARKLRKADLEAWAGRARDRYSPTRFNGCLESLRGILAICIEAGVLRVNPAMAIPKASVNVKVPEMPSDDEFQAFLAKLDARPRAKRCAFMARFLAFTGLRINEARHVTAGDVDLAAGFLTARETKNGKPRRVPLIAQAQALLAPVLKDLQPGDRVSPIKEPHHTMNRLCDEHGFPRLRPHLLRHLFATKAIESGVDIPTVAKWLGHQDGGALAMKVYGHLRDNHSREMAGKVQFGVTARPPSTAQTKSQAAGSAPQGSGSVPPEAPAGIR